MIFQPSSGWVVVGGRGVNGVAFAMNVITFTIE